MTYNPTFVPAWAQAHKTDEVTFFFSGTIYTAHLLSARLELNLPNFVGFPNQTFLFASTEIPRAYLPFVLTHEIREFIKYKNLPGRCLQSLFDELASVPDDIKIAYINFRYTFFKQLVTFYKNKSGVDVDGLKFEIAKSLAHLKQLVDKSR